jgi:hypothetical protein
MLNTAPMMSKCPNFCLNDVTFYVKLLIENTSGNNIVMHIKYRSINLSYFFYFFLLYLPLVNFGLHTVQFLKFRGFNLDTMSVKQGKNGDWLVMR